MPKEGVTLNILKESFSKGVVVHYGRCSQVGNELGRSGGTLTDSTVANWLVSEGELGQEMTNHIGFDLDWVPVLATVHVDDGVAHLGHDDAVSEMGLDGLWLLTCWYIQLRFSQFLDQSLILSLDSMSESSLLARVHQTDNFLTRHFQEFIQLMSSENLLLEWLLLWWLLGLRHLFL